MLNLTHLSEYFFSFVTAIKYRTYEQFVTFFKYSLSTVAGTKLSVDKRVAII